MHTHQEKGVDVNTEAQKARITLKAIENLTYTCSNPQLLLQLNQTLDRVLSEFRQSLPTEKGYKATDSDTCEKER